MNPLATLTRKEWGTVFYEQCEFEEASESDSWSCNDGTDNRLNGLSEAAELHTLQEPGVAALELAYKESKKTDQYGNKFGYRAKVKDARGNSLGRWSWDVFLRMARP